MNTPEWVPLKELLKVLIKMDAWTMDTKYLNIYLDTRFLDGDFYCTIKDREGKRYLSLNDLKEIRKIINE